MYSFQFDLLLVPWRSTTLSKCQQCFSGNQSRRIPTLESSPTVPGIQAQRRRLLIPRAFAALGKICLACPCIQVTRALSSHRPIYARGDSRNQCLMPRRRAQLTEIKGLDWYVPSAFFPVVAANLQYDHQNLAYRKNNVRG